MKTTYSRRELYALGEPFGNSSTERKVNGSYLCGGGGGGGVLGAVVAVVATVALAIATDGASLALEAAAEGAAAAAAEGLAADAVMEIGAEAVIEAGIETAAESAITDTALETAAETALETAAETGAESLAESGIENLAESGIENLAETGIENLAETGIENFAEKGLEQLGESSLEQLGDNAVNTTFDNALNTAETLADNASPLDSLKETYNSLDPVAKGALKGVGKNLITSAANGRDINPLSLATSAVTGGVSAGASDLAGGGVGGALAGTAASTAAGMGIKEALGGQQPNTPIQRVSQPTVKPAPTTINPAKQQSTLATLNSGENNSGHTSFAGTAPLGLNGTKAFDPLRPQDSIAGAGMFDKSGLPVSVKGQAFTNPSGSNDNANLMQALNQLNPKLIGQIYKRGGIVKRFANGGHVPEFRTGSGVGIHKHYVKGEGDGQSDDIPAMLADGEYVFDADTVAQLGNGSSDAGAQLLDHFREALREHKRSAPANKIPHAASPLAYMKEALKRHGAKQKKG